MSSTILFDCERMKYPHTGLYHYCKQLGKALLENQQQPDYSLSFYVPAEIINFFGADKNYLIQKSWHKLFQPNTKGIHLWHGTYQGSNYYPTSKKFKKILTIHDLNFLYDEGKNAIKKKIYLKKVQNLIDRSDYLTVISAFTLQCIQENLRVDHKPVDIIFNGCNLPGEDTAYQKPSFISSETPFIFSIGTITAKKNFHTLPALLVGNDYQLIIAGVVQDPHYLEVILHEAKKHGVADRVIIPGIVTENEKWWLLQYMQAFVFPSISEGFGLPVVEAMHFGKPVILSTLTCLPETGGNAAYYFNTFEPADMQKTFQHSLHHYHSHPDQKNIIKKRAAFFNWNEAAMKYWNLYERLLSNKE